MRKLNAARLESLLRTQAEEDIRHARLSGAAMTVLQAGEPVCTLRVGTRSPLSDEPMPPRALFRLASMTKPVTAVAALIGAERGWYSLDDRLADHVPAFARMQVGRLEGGRAVPDHPARSPITLRQLLTHTNGILAQNDLGMLLMEETPAPAYASLRAMADYAAGQCLCFDPGEATAYTGYASFDIMAAILEEKSGMSFADFIRVHIFDPLGLADMTFSPTEEQWGRMAGMYDRTVGGGLAAVDIGRHTFEGFPLSYTCAGASLAGTLEDYTVFAEMLRQGGAYRGVRIVDAALMAQLARPYVPADLPGRDPWNSWGLGVRVADASPLVPAGSFGWSGAYGTHFWVDPENAVTAVFMRSSRWEDSHGAGRMGLRFEKNVRDAMEGPAGQQHYLRSAD